MLKYKTGGEINHILSFFRLLERKISFKSEYFKEFTISKSILCRQIKFFYDLDTIIISSYDIIYTLLKMVLRYGSLYQMLFPIGIHLLYNAMYFYAEFLPISTKLLQQINFQIDFPKLYRNIF